MHELARVVEILVQILQDTTLPEMKIVRDNGISGLRFEQLGKSWV